VSAWRESFAWVECRCTKIGLNRRTGMAILRPSMDDLTKSYQLFGLKPGASAEEAKQAYRDLVRVWHPDRFEHDERLRMIAQNKLKEINGAYKVLEAHFFDQSG